ncbi:SPOR domain-containing protein [Comamonas sp. 4034]|uniref:SPOR domain-containing protein n=1 Tax=Comamonas sp. 4034 TaxID=3156455 RepID=UPI003D247214
MIRFAIVLLLLANAGYYAFSHGMLRSLGWAPENPAEPERLQQQVNPEALRIMTREEMEQAQKQVQSAAPAAEAPVNPASEATGKPAAEPDKSTDKLAEKPAEKPEKPEKRECLVAGSFDAKQVEALRLQLVKLPEGSWKLDSTTSAGRWMVYVGKFSSQDALDKRREELRALDISTDRARLASLEPGISLGRFSTEEAAERHLAAMGKKGVSGAKVVVDRPETINYTLRLPRVDAATKKRVQSWHVMDGKDLQACS